MKIKRIEYGKKYEIKINDEIFILEDEKNFYLDKRTNEIYLKNLPENPYLKSISLKKIEKNNGEFISDYIKKERKSSERISKKLDDYMTEKEKSIIEEIKKKCEKRREEEKKKREEEKNNPIKKEERKIFNAIESLRNLGISEESIKKLISGKN
jgi:hypothetical protein